MLRNIHRAGEWSGRRVRGVVGGRTGASAVPCAKNSAAPGAAGAFNAGWEVPEKGLYSGKHRGAVRASTVPPFYV